MPLASELRLKIWQYVIDLDLVCEVKEAPDSIEDRPTNNFHIFPSWIGAMGSNKAISAELTSCLIHVLGSWKMVVMFGIERITGGGGPPRQVPKDRRFKVAAEDTDENGEPAFWNCSYNHGTLWFLVFGLDPSGCLVKENEEFEWTWLSDETPGVPLYREILGRWEYDIEDLLDGKPWRVRSEIPDPELHGHIIKALGLKFEDFVMTPDYHRSVAESDEITRGWTSVERSGLRED